MQRRTACRTIMGLAAGIAGAGLPAEIFAGGNDAHVAGVFALPDAEQKTDATLFVRYTGPASANLEFALRGRPDGKQLTNFDVDMTKRMHVIVVSDDFRSFLHLHPESNAAGLFSLPLTVPARGNYEIYADVVAHGIGRQVFRFPVPFGSGKPEPADVTPTPRTVHTGPYAVTLSTLSLPANKPVLLSLDIAENGAPASELHPYLGGAAHAVFIDARTLSYTHVHPFAGHMRMKGCDMDMEAPAELAGDAKVDPAMTLHVDALAAGTYKLWLQFRGGDALYVAPFVLTAG